MGYEFEVLDSELVINDKDKFNEFKEKLRGLKSAEYFADSLSLHHQLYHYYPDYFKDNSFPVKVKWGISPKFWGLRQIFKVMAEYLTGTIEFKCEYGEILQMEFNNGSWKYHVFVYKEVSLYTLPELLERF